MWRGLGDGVDEGERDEGAVVQSRILLSYLMALLTTELLTDRDSQMHGRGLVGSVTRINPGSGRANKNSPGPRPPFWKSSHFTGVIYCRKQATHCSCFLCNIVPRTDLRRTGAVKGSTRL